MKKKILIVVIFVFVASALTFYLINRKQQLAEKQAPIKQNKTVRKYLKQVNTVDNDQGIPLKLIFYNEETKEKIIIDRQEHNPYKGDMYPPVKHSNYYQTIYDAEKLDIKALSKRFPLLKKYNRRLSQVISYNTLRFNKNNTHAILQYDIGFEDFGATQFEVYDHNGLLFKSEETNNALIEPMISDNGKYLCFTCEGSDENKFSERSYHFFDIARNKLIYIEQYDTSSIYNDLPGVIENLFYLRFSPTKEEIIFIVLNFEKMIKYSYKFPKKSYAHLPTKNGIYFFPNGSIKRKLIEYENDFEKTKINEL